jgi:hypothetical protein
VWCVQGTELVFHMQVYACFAALGVAGSKDSSSVSQDGLAALQQLPAADLATLAVIQQYTAFRQGEVWQDIRAGFSAEGLQLTQEDRCAVPCLVCSRNLVCMLAVLAVQTGPSSRLSVCSANSPSHQRHRLRGVTTAYRVVQQPQGLCSSNGADTCCGGFPLLQHAPRERHPAC